MTQPSPTPLRTSLLLALLLGCPPESPPDPADTGDPSADVTVPMGPGEVRAGRILVDDALFGGMTAEGQQGDLMIYNDRAQFIIQGVREGSFTTWQGGSVIDADIVRPEGQPGRDMVDDWVFVAGNGHIMNPERVWVVDDGGEGGPAVVRAEGPASPLDYIVGFFENPEIIPDQGLWFSTDFVLAPDSPLLEVTTTVHATDGDVTLQLGDIVLGSKERSRVWTPGVGLSREAEGSFPWVALAGQRNEGSLALMTQPDDGEVSPHIALGFMGGLLTTISGFGDPVSISEGERATFTRYYGVGPDLASISDAWLELGAEPVEPVNGTVTAPDGPVAGARVSVLLDGAPWTMAVTDADGAFSATVPGGAEIELVADGRGTGYHTDLDEGAAPYGPYAAAWVQEQALDSMNGGAQPVDFAQGRAWVQGSAPLELGEPATLVIDSGDGLPFEARISYAEGYDGGTSTVVQGSPSGYAALAWARDGVVALPLEPGSYDLMVWRGIRWETHQGAIVLEGGEQTRVEIELEEAYRLDDWLIGDPHSHASASPDGSITMADRLVVQAGQGIQLHFSTDHDHVVDFTPLLEALGLDGVMGTVVSCEMSPIMRGHLNLYPLPQQPELPNNGAWPWWRELVETTTQVIEAIDEQLAEPLVQANHPMDGLASLAGWSPGYIARGDYWCDELDAIEVMNGGNHGEAVEFWLDLASRGLVTAPVGVSDNHGFIGSSGLSVTFVGVGTGDPAVVTDEALIEAVSEQRTIASLGPFLDMSIPPGALVTGPETLEVAVLAPSWIVVDELRLLQDGEVIETVLGTQASFDLDPEQDALYVIEAVGSQSMSPVSGHSPWALSGPILFDVDADGWDPPLEPLVIGG